MPSDEPYDPTGIEYYAIPDFTFSSGTTLHDVNVAYRSINPTSTKGAILIPTCYGGLINSTLSFTTSPNDCFSSYHVIIVAMLGNGESASPSNKSFFPSPGELRYQDVIKSQHLLLTQHLHIDSLVAVLGFSMGAQQAYHWSVMFPSFARHVIPICGSARTSPHNYAFLEGPISALTNSIDYIAWREMHRKAARGETVGTNLQSLVPKRGLKAFGRAYNAWLTSHHWFRERWWAKPTSEGGMGCDSVEAWIASTTDGFLQWNAEDLLVLARMWQMGDISTVIPSQESDSTSEPPPLSTLDGVLSNYNDSLYEKALHSITAKVLLMPCRTDQYFPPEDSEIEMKYLQHGQFAPIESVWGHVAGGGMNPADVEWMNERIGEFLTGE